MKKTDQLMDPEARPLNLNLLFAKSHGRPITCWAIHEYEEYEGFSL